MKRVAVYVLTTVVLIGVLHQRHLASQLETVKKLAPDVYFHEGDRRQGPLQQRLGGLRGLRAGHRRQLPVRRAGDHPEDPRARPTSRSASRSTRTITAITPTATRSGWTTAPSPVAHTGVVERDEEVRDGPLRRQARPLGGRREGARGRRGHEAEAAVAALPATA